MSESNPNKSNQESGMNPNYHSPFDYPIPRQTLLRICDLIANIVMTFGTQSGENVPQKSKEYFNYLCSQLSQEINNGIQLTPQNHPVFPLVEIVRECWKKQSTEEEPLVPLISALAEAGIVLREAVE